MSLEVALRTRGTPRRNDYRDFPRPPTFRWLDEPVSAFTRSESESLIVLAADGVVRVRVTGLASSRRDDVGTGIRYTLFLQVAGTDQAQYTLARRLANAALTSTGRKTLSDALDDTIGPRVDDWYESIDSSEAVKLVIKAIQSEIGRRPFEEGTENLDKGVLIVGSRCASSADVMRLLALTSGDLEGVGAIVDLSNNAQDFTDLAFRGVSTVILADSDTEPERIAPPPVSAKAGEPCAPKVSRTLAVPVLIMMLFLTFLLIVGLVSLIVLVRRE